MPALIWLTQKTRSKLVEGRVRPGWCRWARSLDSTGRCPNWCSLRQISLYCSALTKTKHAHNTFKTFSYIGLQDTEEVYMQRMQLCLNALRCVCFSIPKNVCTGIQVASFCVWNHFHVHITRRSVVKVKFHYAIWSQTDSKLVADLQRAEIWPII